MAVERQKAIKKQLVLIFALFLTCLFDFVSSADKNVPPNPSKNRKDAFAKLNSRNNYKRPPYFENDVLTKFRYLFLPTWYSDESPKEPLDRAVFDATCEEVKEYYRKMSFGPMELTCEVLTQVTVPISKYNPIPKDLKDAVLAKAKAQGREYGDGTFDGLAVLFNSAESGEMNGYNAASVNNINNFMWIQSIGSRNVIRHEIGHNFGHPHHETLPYQRPVTDDRALEWDRYDGFDMMSGGNNYDISDIHVASKWYFGWVPDSSVIRMQPEGSTQWCPECLSEGTFTIKGFDIRDDPPKKNEVVGIMIPITDYGHQVYSYWLQYRTGNDGDASGGLSVHVSYFSFTQGAFGATYKQWNYDVNGDTPTVLDSFITPGKCYVMEPAANVMEMDPHSADQVIPKVCVNSLNQMQDITVTVSFLDDSIYSSYNTNSVQEIECEKSGTTYNGDVKSNMEQVYRFTGTGVEGLLGISLCPDSTNADSSVTAYVYDRYPYNVMNLGQPYSYGAFESVTATAADCCTPGTSLKVAGAKVVKITMPDTYEEMYLNEIEIYNQNNVNVAPNGKCYDYWSPNQGEPSCLNDQQIGLYPDTCSSNSFWYSFCVLDESVDVSRIVIYATDNPDKPQWLDRLADLTVDVFADVTGLGYGSDTFGKDVEFVGLLGKFQTGFSRQDKSPKEIETSSLADSYPCPRKQSDPPTPEHKTKSQLGGGWILVAPNDGNVGDGTQTEIVLTCQVSDCSRNHYMNGGKCKRCPDNHLSNPGSTSINQCEPCFRIESGYIRPHPLALACIFVDDEPVTDPPTSAPESFPTLPPVAEPTSPTSNPTPSPTSPAPPTSSSNGYREWRLWSQESFVEWAEKWAVAELKFYENSECTGTKINTDTGNPFDSGHFNDNTGPEKAFDDNDNSRWAGEWNNVQDQEFWVGMEFDSPVKVMCISFLDIEGKGTAGVKIQAYNENLKAWVDFAEENHTPGNLQDITLTYPSTLSPTSSPTKSPTSSPTKSPTFSPTACPQGQFEFIIHFYPDKKSKKENQWTVSKQKAENEWKAIETSPKFKKQKLYEHPMCLKDDECYRFELTDKKGTGICCDKGKGYYSLFLGEEEIEYSRFENGFQKIYDVGNC